MKIEIKPINKCRKEHTCFICGHKIKKNESAYYHSVMLERGESNYCLNKNE